MVLKREIRKLVDPATGQEEGDLPVLIHQSVGLRDKWMFSHVKGHLRLAKEGLSGRDYDVLMVYQAYLRYDTEHDNYVQITQQEIADYLGIQERSVRRSTKKLLEKKILVEGPRIGRNKTYMLNAFFGWKGKVTENYYRVYESHSRILDEFG